MKTDQQLFNEFWERNGKPRLLPDKTVLQLMGKARMEVINDAKDKMPTMETLKKDFNGALEKSKTDPKLVACYSRLEPDKAAWVWFTQGAAAALKKFKDADTTGK